MTETNETIGLGGGCHWCTEAVFEALCGVSEVHSGWIASTGHNSSESEAVLVHFDPEKIALETLIDIHTLTHASSANHSMRDKYRSAIYVFSEAQAASARDIVNRLTATSDRAIITQILVFSAFRPVSDAYKNYYFSAPDRPFCVNIIEPKLKKLLSTHRDHIDEARLPPK